MKTNLVLVIIWLQTVFDEVVHIGSGLGIHTPLNTRHGRIQHFEKFITLTRLTLSNVRSLQWTVTGTASKEIFVQIKSPTSAFKEFVNALVRESDAGSDSNDFRTVYYITKELAYIHKSFHSPLRDLNEGERNTYLLLLFVSHPVKFHLF